MKTKSYFISILCLLLGAGTALQAKTRKALYIIVDGISQSELERIHPTTLFEIAQEGGYSHAYCGGEVGSATQTPTISAIGYTNILTGTWMNKHNVQGNSDIHTNYNYWNIFRIAENQHRDVKTALFSGWTDNRTLLIGEKKPEAGNLRLDYVYDGYDLDTAAYPHKPMELQVFDYDSVVCQKAAECIRRDAPDLSWVYLWYSDDAYHITGNSAFSEQYVHKEDAIIRQIWEAIQYREKNCDEEWLLIITTDHGRQDNGFNHGGQSESERGVWMITNRRDMNEEWGSDNLSHVDVNPSICQFMGFDVPRDIAWEQEGLSFFGTADIYELQCLGHDTQVELTWKCRTLSEKDADEKADIYASSTNNFQKGGKDKWVKVGSVKASEGHYMVDLSKLEDSDFYKFEVVTSHNHQTRWYTRRPNYNFAKPSKRPKLVVGVIIDQMRWDYLTRFENLFGKNGFCRLEKKGFSFDNTQIDYIPTVTACGHSCIYSGSVPAITGIAGNYFYIDGHKTYCTDDSTVTTIGSNTKQGQMSPRLLRVSTMCDAVKQAQDFKSKVIGVSLKDRGAILPAGHAADAAYWYDNQAGHFITSSYYMNQLPRWVEDFNKQNQVDAASTDIRYTPQGNEMVMKMAIAALKNEQLGKGDATDFLAVSFSSTDYVGHRFGTNAPETRAVYQQMDNQLAQLLAALDEEVGKGNYLLFLAADHAAATNHLEMQAKRFPAGIYNRVDETAHLNTILRSQYSLDYDAVLDIQEFRLYLDHNAIAKDGKLSESAIKEALVQELEKDDRVVYAIDYDKLSTNNLPEIWSKKMKRGYNQKRSGDIQIILQPGYYLYDDEYYEHGTDHGSIYSYDAHIPFLMYGWHITPGCSSVSVSVDDIAATICDMLKVHQPDGCLGTPRTEQLTK